MRESLIRRLCCPSCRGGLSWRVDVEAEGRILQARAECGGCGRTYPVSDGIGVFLESAAGEEDLWQTSESGLAAFLSENPDVERELMESPLSGLGPADLFLRAMAHEERGEAAEAAKAREMALPDMYTEDYHRCLESQTDYVLERVSGDGDFVVDLASGMGALVERLAMAGAGHVVSTDISPLALLRSRRRMEELGLAEGMSFLALDARSTPFRDGAVETMTSLLGLANVQHPEGLLEELRRVVSGRLMAVHHFYPRVEDGNTALLREHGLDTLMLEGSFMDLMRKAGWEVLLANRCSGRAEPTPPGRVIEGARFDALPAEPTVLKWATVVAM
ncbi:MAG: methyltransferase domain-containing protein [Candidatus Fermentibacteraceae bacterium]